MSFFLDFRAARLKASIARNSTAFAMFMLQNKSARLDPQSTEDARKKAVKIKSIANTYIAETKALNNLSSFNVYTKNAWGLFLSFIPSTSLFSMRRQVGAQLAKVENQYNKLKKYLPRESTENENKARAKACYK